MYAEIVSINCFNKLLQNCLYISENLFNFLYTFFPFTFYGALGLLGRCTDVNPRLHSSLHSTYSFQWHTAILERNLYWSSPNEMLLSWKMFTNEFVETFNIKCVYSKNITLGIFDSFINQLFGVVACQNYP